MSMTTGEVNAKLPEGMSITPALIQSLGVKPAEFVKGKPKWAENDLMFIRDCLIERLQKMDCGSVAIDDEDEL